MIFKPNFIVGKNIFPKSLNWYCNIHVKAYLEHECGLLGYNFLELKSAMVNYLING